MLFQFTTVANMPVRLLAIVLSSELFAIYLYIVCDARGVWDGGVGTCACLSQLYMHVCDMCLCVHVYTTVY